jgi:hypothetical protein
MRHELRLGGRPRIGSRTPSVCTCDARPLMRHEFGGRPQTDRQAMPYNLRNNGSRRLARDMSSDLGDDPASAARPFQRELAIGGSDWAKHHLSTGHTSGGCQHELAHSSMYPVSEHNVAVIGIHYGPLRLHLQARIADPTDLTRRRGATPPAASSPARRSEAIPPSALSWSFRRRRATPPSTTYCTSPSKPGTNDEP